MDKTKPSGFTGDYQTALRDHLAPGAPDGLSAALKLGGEAAVLGLKTLELAKLHRKALKALLLPVHAPAARDDMTARAALFFAGVNTPLEQTHCPVLEGGPALEKLNATLLRRTAELADSRVALKDGIIRRKAAESALQTSEDESARLLEEARQLQEHLQDLARRILTSQEEERRAMSLTLQDEIAQTLLGIHVRLLALQSEVSISTGGFQKEIAITRRLVQESVQTINRFAREFAIHHEK